MMKIVLGCGKVIKIFYFSALLYNECNSTRGCNDRY